MSLSNRTSQTTVRRMMARAAILLVMMAVAYAFRDRDVPPGEPDADQPTAARPISEDTPPPVREAEADELPPKSDVAGGGVITKGEPEPSDSAAAEVKAEAPPARKPTAEKSGAPPAKSGSTKQDPKSTAKQVEKPPDKDAAAADVIFRNVTIRDQSDRVVYRGDINLTPTLERIRNGSRNEHRNDGSTFQNREKRLPKREDGYYKEYVHPTRGVSGPGPQRVIMGKGGEVYYTSDHYGSFKRVR